MPCRSRTAEEVHETVIYAANLSTKVCRTAELYDAALPETIDSIDVPEFQIARSEGVLATSHADSATQFVQAPDQIAENDETESQISISATDSAKSKVSARTEASNTKSAESLFPWRH